MPAVVTPWASDLGSREERQRQGEDPSGECGNAAVDHAHDARLRDVDEGRRASAATMGSREDSVKEPHPREPRLDFGGKPVPGACAA